MELWNYEWDTKRKKMYQFWFSNALLPSGTVSWCHLVSGAQGARREPHPEPPEPQHQPGDDLQDLIARH